MSGNGWCTHPDRQVSSDVRILVRKAELACRNAWGSDLWEPANAENAPAAQSAKPIPDHLPSTPVRISYDDEVTSVVASDEHKRRRAQLDDEVVDQSVYKLADDDYDAEQDERRDLFYRDSRSAIERARQRHMSRRAPLVEPEDDDAVIEAADVDAAPAAQAKPTFEPDDFVEDEAPQVTPADEHDDALISEGIRTTSPRARRLRRFRDNPQAPKEMTVAKSEPEPDVVDQELPPSAAPERGRFDSIPEISAEIDLPLLRRPSSAPEPTSRPATNATRAASPFDRALKHAHELNQASRREHNQQRRPLMPAPVAHASPMIPDFPEMPTASAQARPSVDEDAMQPGTSAVLHGHATVERVEEPDGRMRMQPRTAIADRPRADEPLIPSPEVRQSWWRGANRTAEAERLQASEATASAFMDIRKVKMPPVSETLDLRRDEDLQAFRSRLFANGGSATPKPAQGTNRGTRNPISPTRRERQPAPSAETRPREPSVPARGEARAEARRETQPAMPGRITARHAPQRAHLAEPEQDVWYGPDELPAIDVRQLLEDDGELLDMKIEIAPGVPKMCATCRSYRPSEQAGRGWCTNNWAFTHRQMVNEGDIACDSTIGCWWLPADEEVWLDDFEVAADATTRVDRLLARLHPDRQAVGNE